MVVSDKISKWPRFTDLSKTSFAIFNFMYHFFLIFQMSMHITNLNGGYKPRLRYSTSILTCTGPVQLAKKRTQVVSFHRLSGTGMTSLIHLSPLLKCLMTVCPSSLHSCVKGLISPPSEPPGEIMSFGVSPVN